MKLPISIADDDDDDSITRYDEGSSGAVLQMSGRKTTDTCRRREQTKKNRRFVVGALKSSCFTENNRFAVRRHDGGLVSPGSHRRNGYERHYLHDDDDYIPPTDRATKRDDKSAHCQRRSGTAAATLLAGIRSGRSISGSTQLILVRVQDDPAKGR